MKDLYRTLSVTLQKCVTSLLGYGATLNDGSGMDIEISVLERQNSRSTVP